MAVDDVDAVGERAGVGAEIDTREGVDSHLGGTGRGSVDIVDTRLYAGLDFNLIEEETAGLEGELRLARCSQRGAAVGPLAFGQVESSGRQRTVAGREGERIAVVLVEGSSLELDGDRRVGIDIE